VPRQKDTRRHSTQNEFNEDGNRGKKAIFARCGEMRRLGRPRFLFAGGVGIFADEWSHDEQQSVTELQDDHELLVIEFLDQTIRCGVAPGRVIA
jgi:hypothetical protein